MTSALAQPGLNSPLGDHRRAAACSSMRPGIVLCPPLVVSEGAADELVRRLRLTLEDTWDWVRGTF